MKETSFTLLKHLQHIVNGSRKLKTSLLHCFVLLACLGFFSNQGYSQITIDVQCDSDVAGAQAAAEAAALFALDNVTMVGCINSIVSSSITSAADGDNCTADAATYTVVFDADCTALPPPMNINIVGGTLPIVVNITTADPPPTAPADGGSTVECSTDAVPPANPGTLTDNCGEVITPIGPTDSGPVTCDGTRTYTWTYTFCDGTTDDYVYTYTITGDVTADEVPTSPAAVTVNCYADAVTPTAPATITDNCGEAVTLTGPVKDPAAAPVCPNIGTVTYTWTYTYCSGTTADYVFTYTVMDITPPVLTSSCPTLTDVVPVDGSCEASFPDVISALTGTDACGGTVTFTQSPTAGSPMTIAADNCGPSGQAVGAAQGITITMEDCAGNSTTVCGGVTRTPVDDTDPTVTGPTTIDVLVSFDDVSCVMGEVTVDIAYLLAAGIGADDNCDVNAFLTSAGLPRTYDCGDIGTSDAVTVIANDCNGNTSAPGTVITFNIIGDDDFVSSWSLDGGDLIVCPDEFPIDIELLGNTPSCGVWSGDLPVVDMAGTFQILSDPGAGTYSLTYTVGQPDCHVETTHNIRVEPTFDNDDAALVGPVNLCLAMGETFDLEGLLAPGSVDGGTFTIGAGPSGYTLIGSLLTYTGGGDQALSITYTLTDCDGDTELGTTTLNIYAKPYGEFALPTTMCQDEAAASASVSGIPQGNSFEFTSSPAGFITAGGSFDPAGGALSTGCADILVTMRVYSDNGTPPCSDYSVAQYVRVCETGSAAWTAASSVCISGSDEVLALGSTLNANGVNNLLPGNVTWTGEGVTEDVNGLTAFFDPAAAGLGVHNICVTVGDASCDTTECHDIEVLPDYDIDDVALTEDFSVCLLQDDIIDFYSLLATGSNNNGQFSLVSSSVAGQVNGSGFEFNGGCGSIVVSYGFADDCAGSTTDDVTITIYEKPDIGNIDNVGPLCSTETMALINYSGDAQICGIPGTFAVQPPTDPASLFDTGTGDQAIFNPSIAGEGLHFITYTTGNPAGCTENITVAVVVRASSDPAFSIADEVCLGDVTGGISLSLTNADASVAAGSPDGVSEVIWFGGLTGDVVDATGDDPTGVFTPSQAGTYTICVKTGDAGCAQIYCEDIIVHENVDAALIGPNLTVSCEVVNSNGYFGLIDLNTLLTAGSTTGGVWTLNSGPGGLFNNQLDGVPGCYNLTYTVSSVGGDPGPCTDAESIDLLVTEKPEPSFDLAEEVCWDGVAGSATLPTLYNGQTFGTNGTISYTWEVSPTSNAPTFSDFTVKEPELTVQGAGTFEVCLTEVITYDACGTIPADASCSVQVCHTLTIHETNVEVIPVWNSFTPVCESGDPVDLDELVPGTSTQDGVFTGTGVSVDGAHPDYVFNPGATAITDLLATSSEGFVDVSVCYTVGNSAGCDATECHTIRVYADVVGDIEAITQCNDANTQIDLTAMLGAGTTPGGVFSFTGVSGAPGTAGTGSASATIAGDILTYPLTLGTPGDFTFDITYTVGNTPPGGACTATDNAIVTILNEAPTVASCPVDPITVATPAVTSGTHPHCGVAVTYDTPTFDDDCDGTGLVGSLIAGGASGTLFEVGVTTVTWQYFDESGNGPADCTFTVTVTDETLPSALCNEDGPSGFGFFISLNGTGNAYVTPADIDNGSFDNCGIANMQVSRNGINFGHQEAFSCDDINTTFDITLRVEDVAGNVGSCIGKVTIKDNEIPDIECPGNIVWVNDPGVCEARVEYPRPVVTDNCDAWAVFIDGHTPPLATDDPVWTDIAVGTLTVRWEGVDQTGILEPSRPRDTCEFTITVVDAEMPVLACDPTLRVRANDDGDCSFTMPGGGFDVTGTDNCVPPGTLDLTHDYPVATGYAVSNTTLAGATFPVGITDILWTAIDPHGNKATCTVQIEINDEEDPTVQSCPTSFSQGTDADICGAGITYDIPQFADNCDGTDLEGVLVSGYAPGTDFPEGVTTVTWEYTDLADNATATCTFTVTVNDDDAPTPVCQTGLDAVLDGDGVVQISADDIDLGSYDNCGIVTTLISREVGLFLSAVTFDCEDIDPGTGTVTVTLQVTDAAGNSSECTTDVTVLDLQVPDIECPGSITVTADSPDCAAVVTYPAPTVTDNCSFTVTQTDGTGLTSGSSFPVGTTVQTYEATDIAGNTESCTFTIYVYDEVAPTINCGETVRTRSADADMCSFTMPGAGFDATGADNCGAVTITHNYPYALDPNTLAGSSFPVGSTTVTWTATDASGNQSSICGIEIVVTDDQDPTIDCGVSGGPANALVNGSFEAGGPFNTQGADGWNQFGPAFRLFASVDPNAFFTHDGDVMMKLFDVNSGLFQDLPVSPGDELEGSLWIRNAGFDPISAGREGFLKFEFMDAGGAQIGVVESTRLGSTLPFDVWTEVTLSAVAPAGAASVRFVVIQTAPGGPGAVMFDDASLNITSPPAVSNVLLNPSFEAGGPFNSQGADNWVQFDNVFRLFESVSPDFFTHDGDVMLKLFGPVAGMFQDVTVTPDDELNGSLWIRNAGFDPIAPGQEGFIKFEFFDAGGAQVGVFESSRLGSSLPLDVWTEVTLNAVVPAGVTTVRFVAVQVGPGPGAIMFDDASLTIGSDPVSGDISVNNDPGECGANIDIDNPMADDNCGIVSIINDYNYTSNASDFYPVGSTQVGFTVTDAAGNTAECFITVDVADVEAPVFVNCPTTMVMVGNDVDECTGKLNWSVPVATDNCEVQLVAQTGGPASGTAVPVGTAMTVTYTATDINGNANTCMFDIQVIDTQEPSFDADIVMPGDITVECDAVPTNCVFHGFGDPCEILDNDDVNDNCTASADLVIGFNEDSTQDPDPNVCGHYNYTITRTWTVTDEAGNVLTHIQVITVQDTTPPVPVCQNADIILDKAGNASIDPSTLIEGTTDNCAPFDVLDVVASQVDFTCADLGDNSVTLTISDPCLNSATCTIIVNVVEGPAPCTPEAELTSSCLDNATTLENGQFGEFIQVTSLAMQTWTVASSNGLYTATSPDPPAAPTAIAGGTALTSGTADGIDNDGDGQIDEADEMIYYTISGRYVEAIGYSANLVNNLGQTLAITNVAHYPTPVLDLPSEICLGTDPFVPIVTDQYAGDGAYVTIEYYVDGVLVTEIDPAALGLGQHTIEVIVDANGFANSRYINGVLVPGDAVDSDEARLDPGCVQSILGFFAVVSTPSQVTCNDLINLTIGPDCESVILPDQVLEGSYACFDDYEVVLYTANGVPLSPSNVVTSDEIGLTLVYHLNHPISGNVCWGQISVEDKNAPTVVCPDNVTVMCTVDPDSVVYWVPGNHPDFPARDFFGNLVPSGSCDSVLYFGHPSADDCSPILPLDCGGRTWTFNDDYTTYECADNPALLADIVRTFVVEDKWGNYTTCTQNLTWVRGEADQVTWPADYHTTCNAPSLAALVASNYSTDITGVPYIFDAKYGTLNTIDNGICELGLTYEDQLVNICAEEYKVVRTWTIYDWCPEPGNPTITEHIQNIKVENLAPVISVDCIDYTPQGYCVLNATEPGNLPHYACSAIYVPFANIDAVCDELVEVSVETPLGNTTNGGALPSPGLPIGGPYTIVYRAEDKCGNITQYELEVVVEDRTAPIAICDEITDVNIGALGQGTVYAETFDDGSYDGCALDHFLVRRMDSTCGSTSFGPSITFNCCDAENSPVMVVFRAVDYVGNTNDCMVEVNVNDKLPPVLVSCPANERVSCDWYAEFLETQLAGAADDDEECDILSDYFGDAQYLDNCNPDVGCTVTINLDQCLEGTIRRSWIAEDDAGNTNSSQNCNQTIFVDHVSDFVIEFPEDLTVECGTDLPDFGEPEIFYESCELVAVSYEDEIFTDVVDACYKISRQWTVINWCVVGDEIDQEVTEDSELAMRQAGCLSIVNLECDLDGDGDCDDRTFRDSWAICNLPDAAHATQSTDPDTDSDSDPWDGFITYQQVIKVNDTVDPIFTDGCDIPDICISDNTCTADFVLPTPAIDECSSVVTFSVTSSFGQGFGPFTDIAPGTYTVRYVAMDNCNNQTDCQTTVTVVDCKKPTPYCKSGLVVELMVVDPPMVEVWAADLDANSFDNCTEAGDLIFSFSADTDDIGFTFNCDHVEDLQEVEIWVTDEAGNQDFCITAIDIQANMGQCDDDSLAVHVAGSINTEQNEGVEDVNVQLSGFGQMSVMTDVGGSFSFPVTFGGDYTVTPTKDDGHLNGVTTYDLVLITKHILGVSLLDSPYKMIAADANKSNTVTTFDLVQVRKLILYLNDKFPSNTSWRFVDKGYNFPNPLNPWSAVFPEVANFNNVAQDVLNADYVAVKIGDVNGSATPNFTSAGEDRSMVGSLVFNVDDQQFEADETYTVDFKATDFDVQGYQFTLNFDQNAVAFAGIAPAIAGAENFGLALLEEGVITASWNDDDVKLAGDQVIFSLEFKALQNVKLSEAIVVNSRYTVAEAYNTNGELLDVELAFNGATVAAAFELYQNTPNPFSKQTVIGFTLPEASTVKLTITDVSGKVVKVLNGDFERGYNEFKLERREFTSTGIMYYQLDTNTDSATKMMILVD